MLTRLQALYAVNQTIDVPQKSLMEESQSRQLFEIQGVMRGTLGEGGCNWLNDRTHLH